VNGVVGAGAVLMGAGLLSVIVSVVISLSWVARQLVTYRRSAGDRRQQLKWLVSGAAVLVLSLVAVDLVSGQVGQASRAIAFFGLAALPVSIGVAILKYRLYEIDRIICRTLAYALVTGLLVALYAGLVLLSTDVLSLSSPVAVAASARAAEPWLAGQVTLGVVAVSGCYGSRLDGMESVCPVGRSVCPDGS